MRQRTTRLVALTAAGLCLLLPATAHAGIWTSVTTPTSQTITAIDYQGGDRLWFTTSSSIYKRNGAGWTEQRNAPGSNFNAIEFNPSGTRGLAVGDAGVIWRYDGSTWTKLAAPQTYNYPWDSCTTTPGGPYTLTSPVTADFNHVRWVNDTTVFIFSERIGSLMRSTNSGASFQEIDRQSDGTCRINSGGYLNDAFVLPSNPQYMLFLSSTGYVFHSSNGLASQAADRGYACADRMWPDPSNPALIYAGGAGCWLFGVSENGANGFTSPRMMNGDYGRNRALDVNGKTVLGVGDAGLIYNSIDRREAYLQPAEGAMATNDWRAADVATARDGAVGGLNGGLLLTHDLDKIPDIVKPTGSIGGPASGVAGTPLTFTADVSDSGSGIDPAGLSWTKDDAAAGTGASLTITFPTSGYYELELAFRDRAGNTGSARKYVSISQTPRVVDTTDPTGRITGPAYAVAGESATFTVNATDSGSGIDPTSFRWTRDSRGIAVSGASVSVPFPEPGVDTVAVSFSDNAGNDSSASVRVPVAPKPEDRPKPATAPGTVTPTIGKAKGGNYTIPIKGGYTLPKNVTAALGCNGEVLFTMKKAKTLISARSTKLNKQCRYAKRFRVAKGKVGSARTVAITIRFPGNPWLAPVKKTYQVKVPKG
jgi:hypothetical protein